MCTTKDKMAFNKEAEPEIVVFPERYKVSSVQDDVRSKMGLFYAMMSMTTYATCVLCQFTEKKKNMMEKIAVWAFPCEYCGVFSTL